jgi:hypothetical protein
MANLNALGFIIDAPRALIKTKDNVKSIVNASSGEVTFSGDSIEINGGTSAYPIQEIDTKSNIEIKLTDTEFSLDTFKMTSGGTIATGAMEYEIFGYSHVIGSTGEVIIPKAVVAGSVSVNDYVETTSATPATGEFKVTIAAGTTTLLFPVADADKTVYPAYKISVTEGTSLTVKTTDVPSSGQITLEFPVYADPESDSSDIIGYTQILIYKGKIKKESKIGGAYKSASTFDITIKGLDSKRQDGAMWKATFISKADYVG